MRRLMLPALVISGLTLLLWGCGGSDETTSLDFIADDLFDAGAEVETVAPADVPDALGKDLDTAIDVVAEVDIDVGQDLGDVGLDLLDGGGDGDLEADGDASPEADGEPEVDADTVSPAEKVVTVTGQVCGGALTSSTNYSMRIVVGGGPMSTTQSNNYELSIGFGALVNQ